MEILIAGLFFIFLMSGMNPNIDKEPIDWKEKVRKDIEDSKQKTKEYMAKPFCYTYALHELLPNVDVTLLEKDFTDSFIKNKIKFQEIIPVARKHGLELKEVKLNSYDDLKNITEPVITRTWNHPEGISGTSFAHHVFVVKKANDRNVTVMNDGKEEVWSKEKFTKMWDKEILIRGK